MLLIRAFVYLLLVCHGGRHAFAAQPQIQSKDVAAEAAKAARPGEQRPTTAERIAGLERLLNADRQRQAELKRQIEQLQQEFDERSAEFTEKDARVNTERAALESTRQAAEQASRRQGLQNLQQERENARAGFDRVISRRKAVQEQLEILSEKIELEENALERLKSAEPETSVRPGTSAQPTPDGSAAPPAAKPRQGSGRNDDPPATAPTPPAGGTSAENEATADHTDESTLQAEPQPVLDARRELQSRRHELQLANQRARLLEDSIVVFERDLQSAEHLLAVTRQEAEAAAGAVRQLKAELQERRRNGVEQPALQPVEQELAAEEQRLESTQSEIALQTTRVTESRALLERLKESRSEAAGRVAEATQSVNAAETRLAVLNSPVAPHRISEWVRHTGPRVVGLLLLLLFVWWGVRVVAKRGIGALARRSRHGTLLEREQRAETLQRVFQYAVSMAVITLGLLAILHTSGIDVSVLFGGAAVIGAAVAFGSQNLIKDYFTGFMILAENQYSVGNVVTIAGTTGVVEDISLRVTVLRDEEGALHFVPHGQVTKVSNLTHGWSRAVLQVPIGYRENVDHVMTVLMDLAREMRDDPQFGPQMLGQPEMQGVEAFGQSAVVVKLLVKTRPHMQWGVKRELLRRIKKEFDRQGIEIPYPQWVVHQAAGDPESAEPQLAET